jgi:hypothetical protein
VPPLNAPYPPRVPPTLDPAADLHGPAAPVGTITPWADGVHATAGTLDGCLAVTVG